MSGDVDVLLASGDAALRAGDWAAARAAFEGVLEREEVPEAMFGLGDALWWLGEIDLAIGVRERAYGAFRSRPDPAQAAIVAMRLCLTYRANIGNHALARGWAARAVRLVEDFGVEQLRGWALLTRALVAEDAAEGEAMAREAHDFARRSGDADLELSALSEIGAWLVEGGNVEDGVSLLDEAMAGSLGGEGRSLNTVVYTSCHTLISCSRAAEFERAAQWIRALDKFSRRYGCPFLYTMCRTLYGAVLFATGDWSSAETEFDAALRMSKSSERALYGEALARLAELRLAQGRIEEVERLIAGYEDHVSVALVVGAIHLARAEPAAAESIATRWLQQIGEDRLESAPLLELRGGAEFERGAVREATSTAEHLVSVGERFHCKVIVARGQRLLGRAVAASGDRRRARSHLDLALAAFARLEMTLETGRTHLLLARCLFEDEADAAIAEARAALATFGELGAARDADAAASLLRSLGVRAVRAGAGGVGGLTKRELEVLELLGEGLQNREIAERLFLTRKTVEHHVARVLSKLSLRSRAEAAAYAARNLKGGPVAD